MTKEETKQAEKLKELRECIIENRFTCKLHFTTENNQHYDFMCVDTILDMGIMLHKPDTLYFINDEFTIYLVKPKLYPNFPSDTTCKLEVFIATPIAKDNRFSKLKAALPDGDPIHQPLRHAPFAVDGRMIYVLRDAGCYVKTTLVNKTSIEILKPGEFLPLDNDVLCLQTTITNSVNIETISLLTPIQLNTSIKELEKEALITLLEGVRKGVFHNYTNVTIEKK